MRDDMADATRACAACGARLAADNSAPFCSPCARAGRRVHALPEAFWESDAIKAIADDRDFGRLLLAIRRASNPALKQAEMADRLGITQSQISRIERGSTVIRDLDKLERWAIELGIPQSRLWFTLSPQSVDAYRSGLEPPTLDNESSNDGVSMHRRQFIKSTGVIATAKIGSSLVGVARLNQVQSTVRVGDPEVDLVREVTAAFRKVDNKYGGGHSRSAAHAYLNNTVDPLLKSGRMRETIRKDLFTAAAELQQLAGWMSYDTGHIQDGKRHLRTALRLCQEAGDDAMSAEMLAGMSHQAAFHKSPDFALDLALAAKQSARRSGIAALQAEAAVMEAHALALLGDREWALTALSEAETLSTRMGEDVPSWLRYFDDAYLAAKFAHTFHTLGDFADAEIFARRSLEMSTGFERGRLFNTALLATVLADAGKVDEACETGRGAVGLSTAIRSTRGMTYLGNLSRSLATHSRMADVRDLNIQLRDLGIEPTPSISIN